MGEMVQIKVHIEKSLWELIITNKMWSKRFTKFL